MVKKSSLLVLGALVFVGLMATAAIVAAYGQGSTNNANYPAAHNNGQQPPYSQQPYGAGGMMGGGMMGGYRRGMMGGYASNSNTPNSSTPGSGPGWSMGGMWALCANWMRSLWQEGRQAQQPNQIAIAGYSFAPQVITVKAGTTLTWINYDSVAHSVNSGTPTNQTNLFDSGDLATGQSYSYEFAQAGTYTYYCDLHTGMTGVVIVEP